MSTLEWTNVSLVCVTLFPTYDAFHSSTSCLKIQGVSPSNLKQWMGNVLARLKFIDHRGRLIRYLVADERLLDIMERMR